MYKQFIVATIYALTFYCTNDCVFRIRTTHVLDTTRLILLCVGRRLYHTIFTGKCNCNLKKKINTHTQHKNRSNNKQWTWFLMWWAIWIASADAWYSFAAFFHFICFGNELISMKALSVSVILTTSAFPKLAKQWSFFFSPENTHIPLSCLT